MYLLALLMLSALAFSQSANEYKYVIVASKFSAQKKPGQFGLNDLTKLFMEKNGYTVYFDTDILPASVATQSCDKMYVDVVEQNNMFVTKLTVVIKDCRNAVLFTSEEGKSSEKEYHTAYNQALRMAFKSFDKPEFKYIPNANKNVEIADAVSHTDSNVGNTDKTATPEGMLLFAQPIENGFQLVDTTPKIVMKIFKTSQPDVFMVAGQKGMVVKKGAQWLHEYYENDKLVSQPLNIKF